MWFDFGGKKIPPHNLIWESGILIIEWWNNVLHKADYIQCLLYVEFLDQNGHILDSVLDGNELEPTLIRQDLCKLDWVEIQYTMMGQTGSGHRYNFARSF